MDADQVAHFMELEEKLSKIRKQLSSKLDNQKHIAIILTSVEENIEGYASNDITKNIVQYIIAFMTLLDQSLNPNTHAINDIQLATSATYLLDIILHYTPKTLLRSKFTEVLTKVAPCITDAKSEPLLIRAAIGALEALLLAQDAQAWNNTNNLSVTPKRGLQGLLELCLDARPKIRKRAQEAVTQILFNPPAAPTAEHVAAHFIADFTLKQLTQVINEFNSLSNKKLKVESIKEEINGKITRVTKLVNTVVTTGQWPSSMIEPLCDYLLEVTKSSDQYLVSGAFQCFENLFNSMAQLSSTTGLAENKYVKVLDTIFTLKPSNSDTHLAVSWIAVVVKGITTYGAHQPLKCLQMLPEVFKIISVYLQSETQEVSYSASQCLIAILAQAIKDEILLTKDVDLKIVESVDESIKQLSEIFVEFLTIRYIHAAKEVLNIIATAFQKFRYRANPHLIQPLQIVDKWRINEENYLDYQKEVELVIGSAISAIGPDAVLQYLPLNLINQSNDQPGRAWLLPILRDNIRNAKLSTFVNDLIPTVTHFEATFEQLPEESVQLRVIQTVVDQIWSLLPHFAQLPKDLRESFNDEFAQELCSLLYSKPDLRTTICNSLKMLVESNLLYSQGALADDVILQEQFPVEEAKKNLEYLTTKSSNLLAVFFNVYTQTSPASRGFILETIESYLKITTAEDIEKTFNNVCALLKNSMEKDASNGSAKKDKNVPQLTSTLLDIVITMVNYLPPASYFALFSIFDTTIKSPNNLIQKRSYRIISKLSELPSGSAAVATHAGAIENTLIGNSHTVQAASRASRLDAIKTVVNLLPSDHLNFIVKVVSEVILATKDVNEKTRDLAFATLIAMGHKMQRESGVGVIKIDEESNETQPANISEFFKIVSVGLIGESQHMVSSTITAYSCLMFEFKDMLPSDIAMDIYDTVELYLTSNSKEIAKSAIGFAKVCVLGLPEDLMRGKVPELLPKLLRWSNEHTGHFKQKVKHIIERLIRRFGYDFIDQNFPEDDRKLLTNIRKTNNRMKRREGGTKENSIPVADTGRKFLSAYEEAIYDSDGELKEKDEDNDNEDEQSTKKSAKQYIIEKSGDNPLDLLDFGTLAHISSSQPRKLNKDSNKRISDDAFSFDAEGKLVVNGKEQATKADDEDPLKSISSGINAYLDAVKQGPVRGQRNKLKFKKGSNKEDGDGFSDDEKLPKMSKPNNKNKIGKNFKKNKFKSKRRL